MPNQKSVFLKYAYNLANYKGVARNRSRWISFLPTS